MIHVKEIAANDVAYNDGGAQVEFSRTEFGNLWDAGDVTITVHHRGQTTSSVLTIPDKGNFYAREYSRRNGNSSPLKIFFQNVLKLTERNIGHLLIFEDNTDLGRDFEIYLYKPRNRQNVTANQLQMFNQIQAFEKFHMDDVLRTKPFLLLAGISGTGKSRIVRELAYKSCPKYLRDKDKTTPGNYCMIEVKPNWHDSSEILGYHSNISAEYKFPKFVKFLVKATLHPDVPFFVCMDEMNLAPVEQYFAEMLSILETRKTVGNHIKSGVIVEGKYFKNASKTMPCKDNRDVYMKLLETNSDNVNEEIANSDSLITNGLTLPDNVFIIGTVNMDDTTHQFSRKVIDRAMTIEMNGGNLEDIFGSSNALDYPNEPDDRICSMATLKTKYVSADDVLNDCKRICSDEKVVRFVTGKDVDGTIVSDTEDTLPGKLNAINKILKNTPFQVSYRVFNELVIFLAVLCDNRSNDDKEVEVLAQTALDKITLMKILPRIEGDEDMFTMGDGEENRLVQLRNLFAPNSDSYKKLNEMNERLNNSGFTRFWP